MQTACGIQGPTQSSAELAGQSAIQKPHAESTYQREATGDLT